MDDRKKFDLTFDLAIVTFSLQILSGLYLGKCKVYATLWCDLNLRFDLVIVAMSLKSCPHFLDSVMQVFRWS